MPNRESIPQHKIGAALRDFFDHAASHDEESVQAALCLVVNTDNHVYKFGAGDPDTLAQTIVMALDGMVKEVPGFEKAWQKAFLSKRLQGMISQVLDVMEQTKERADEAKGMDTAKPVADALIEKLKGNQT